MFEPSRWDSEAVLKVRSTPGQAKPVQVANSEFKHLDVHVDSHLNADAADRDEAETADMPKEKKDEALVRITKRDLETYGYHPGRCTRCDELTLGMFSH